MAQPVTRIDGYTWEATPNGNRPAPVLPKKLQDSWWVRLRSWFAWENLTVAGREVKGFVVTPTIAVTICIVFLSAFLGAIGWAYSSSTKDSRETRDAVIRMETMLNERTRNFEREQDKLSAELKDERGIAELHRDNQDKKQMKMEYALRQKGIVIE